MMLITLLNVCFLLSILYKYASLGPFVMFLIIYDARN